MPLTRLVDERILLPIAPDKPCGEDLRGAKDWVEIRRSKPNLDDLADKRDWQPANPVKTDWSTYKEQIEEALCTKTKDLELGVFLLDACVRLYGFAGVRDGVWAVRELLVEFTDKGLYPLPEADNEEARYGKLDWMNEKLAEALREIPITMRPGGATNYSLNYRDEALRPKGMITAAEFEAAAAAGTVVQYETLSTEIKEARSEFDQFEQVVYTLAGPDLLSFATSNQALQDCQLAIDSILRKKQGGASRHGAASIGGAGFTMQVQGQNARLTIPGVLAESANNSWAEAEHRALSGDIDGALSAMAALSAAEPNGRVRFQRKLLLADICLQTGKYKLAKMILEELNELVEEHKLTAWETTELVGAVWGRLVRCYRQQNGTGTGNPEKAAEFFLKLSRLDPWQALAIGEPLSESLES
jgi:type VI secretion system protein ImpA